ncbi:MAG: ATP-dependent protease ATPase subunit HslU [Christensenellaceae bacterium]|jgi:ATP-dependent HslUV protease ATP-binding subunit HslU|nr:ATP-dependent protease ATPase subunit HslU [Christensenellaceae bacterium]
MQLTPRQIVEALDSYIVGQQEAKRAVAIALRNRYRRSRLEEAQREEITPKNILMVGPTGVGKTEIARRLAKLVDAPFVKVEATKFTEVGYVGRDVDSMVRDLVETSLRLVKDRMGKDVENAAEQNAQERILDALLEQERGAVKKPPQNPIEALLTPSREPQLPPEEHERRKTRREELRLRLLAGDLEGQIIEIEVEDQQPGDTIPGTDMSMSDMLGSFMPKKKKLRKVSVMEARRVLKAEEAQKLIDMDAATSEAVYRAEQDGIIFLDEIDKIAGRAQSGQPDVSREGVQRDILPLVEGSTVNTKYGPVRTDHILFIAAGAFHVAKVSDLIPELQGRFPVQVNLQPLTVDDLRQILTQPKNALIKQYAMLLGVDGVALEFREEALDEIAELCVRVNEAKENIGARRLHTLLEYVLQDLAFSAGESGPETVAIDRDYVRAKLSHMAEEFDLSRQII